MGVSQHKENRITREAPSRYGAGLFLGIMMTVSATLMLIMRFTALEIDDVVLSVNDGPAGVISKLMLLAGGLMILIVARDIYLNKFFLEDIFNDLDLSHMDSFLTTILCTIAAVILLFTKHRSIVKTLIISSLVFAVICLDDAFDDLLRLADLYDYDIVNFVTGVLSLMFGAMLIGNLLI